MGDGAPVRVDPLVAGYLTGVSAFVGGLMNAAFLLAGTASSNPVMFFLATGVVLAWRVAGYYDLDYWILPIRSRRGGHDMASSPPGVSRASP